MAVSCNTNDLAQASACYDKCIPPGMHPAIWTYLIKTSVGNTMTINELLAAAAPYDVIPPGKQMEVLIALLCQFLNEA